MPSYCLTTFGCQMNVHDSERMHEVMARAGFEQAPAEDAADVVILNTCSVREKAEQKLLSELGRLAKLKRTRKDLVLVVSGCVAQQEGEKLLKGARGVDLVLGPDNISELPRLLQEAAHGAPPRARTVFDLDDPQFLAAESVADGAVTAFVTTMKGCNERCSFCIVPYTRGPERYRPSHEIVAEIDALVRGGVREVTLLGQTVNSYRDPERRLAATPEADLADEDESEFAALIRAVAAGVPGLARLRYTSPHPRHLTRSLIAAHAELPVLPRHIHLPVQSGSDALLRRMIRRYTRADFLARVAATRARIPDVTFSTDIIVGFPGETDRDFEDTLSLIEEVGFVGVFGFKYSERPYTPALKLKDSVVESAKEERLARLFALSERLVAEHLAGLTGTTVRVLIEGASKKGARTDGPAQRGGGSRHTYSGRTDRHEIVHLDEEAAAGLVGEIVDVHVVRALKHSLVGELDEATRARGLAAGQTGAVPQGVRARRSLPLLPREVTS